MWFMQRPTRFDWYAALWVIVLVVYKLIENWMLTWIQSQLMEYAPPTISVAVQLIPLLTWMLAAAVLILVTKKAAQIHIDPDLAQSRAIILPNGTMLTGENVSSVADAGVGIITINWIVPYRNENYQLFITPNGCLVQRHHRTRTSVTIFLVGLEGGRPADSATLDVLAVGER